MSYKTILAVVRVDQEERDLRDAIELCREVDAHLSVVVVQLAPPPPMGDAGIVATVWLDERQDEQARLEAYVAKVDEMLSATGISYSLEGRFTEIAGAGEELGERARYSDLTILGAGLKLDPDLMSRAIDGCLFNSARPILLAPSAGRMSLRPRNVMIAWDSSLEAALAVRAALDLISQAESVRIVLVDPKAGTNKNGQEPGAEIARYLARHSTAVNVDQLSSMGRPVAEVLQQHAADMSADMIIMGAYGHSRIRERIFGGVTRSMIEGSKIPVFMVH
jgi:nucleotide-binding universal stress UspA family protein